MLLTYFWLIFFIQMVVSTWGILSSIPFFYNELGLSFINIFYLILHFAIGNNFFYKFLLIFFFVRYFIMITFEVIDSTLDYIHSYYFWVLVNFFLLFFCGFVIINFILFVSFV